MKYSKKNQLDWFNNKYFEWQKSEGGRRTISEFANFLGFGQGTVSTWMNGTRRPTPENAVQIAKAIKDFSIFEIMDYEIPSDTYYLLPAGFRDPLENATKEVNQVLKERGLLNDSPEAEKVTIEIFEKWGFKFTAKQKGK